MVGILRSFHFDGGTSAEVAAWNGSRWFAACDQAEKNRLVKKVLLEKEGHYANSNTCFE